jgi:hypothetical protein
LYSPTRRCQRLNLFPQSGHWVMIYFAPPLVSASR